MPKMFKTWDIYLNKEIQKKRISGRSANCLAKVVGYQVAVGRAARGDPGADPFAQETDIFMVH